MVWFHLCLMFKCIHARNILYFTRCPQQFCYTWAFNTLPHLLILLCTTSVQLSNPEVKTYIFGTLFSCACSGCLHSLVVQSYRSLFPIFLFICLKKQWPWSIGSWFCVQFLQGLTEAVFLADLEQDTVSAILYCMFLHGFHVVICPQHRVESLYCISCRLILSLTLTIPKRNLRFFLLGFQLYCWMVLLGLR